MPDDLALIPAFLKHVSIINFVGTPVRRNLKGTLEKLTNLTDLRFNAPPPKSKIIEFREEEVVGEEKKKVYGSYHLIPKGLEFQNCDMSQERGSFQDKDLKKVKVVRFINTPLDKETAKWLRGFPALKELSFVQSEVGDLEFKQLTNMPYTSITLDGVTFGVDQYVSILYMRDLETVTLRNLKDPVKDPGTVSQLYKFGIVKGKGDKWEIGKPSKEDNENSQKGLDFLKEKLPKLKEVIFEL